MAQREFITRLAYRLEERALTLYEKGIDRAKRAVDSFKDRAVKNASGIQKAYNQYAYGSSKVWRDQHGKMHDEHGRFVSKIKRNLLGLEKAHGSLHNKILGLAGAWASFQSIKNFGGQVINTATTFEGLKSSLVTATGSQSAANQEFERLQKFAKQFPAEMDEVVGSYIRLKNLGLDPSNRAMISYGNTASAMNKNITDMIEAVADATTGEFERLKEFGIKAKKDNGMVNFTFRKQQFNVKDNAADIEKFLIGMGEKYFGGGMERQSKTIGGKLSNLKDSFQIAMFKLWEGGLKYPVTAIIEKMTVAIEKYTPKLIELGKKADEWAKLAAKGFLVVTDALNKLKPLLPVVAFGVGTLAARWLGLKAITAGMWIWNAVKAINAMKWATIGFNIAAFAIPAAIGAALAAVVYLGYQIYRYFTQGDGLIARLGKRFPEFKKAFDELGAKVIELWETLKPHIQAVGEKISEISAVVLPVLAKVAQWVLEKVIIPALIGMIKYLIQWLDDIKRGYEIIIPAFKEAWASVTQTIDGLSLAFTEWRQNAVNTINLIKEYLGPLIEMVTNLANGVSSVFSSAGSGGGSGGGAAADAAISNDTRVSNALIKNAQRVATGKSQCYKAVSQAYRNTFGGYDYMSQGGKNWESAYMAASGMAKDPRFKEVRVTPQMLKDPAWQQKLMGSIAVFNRQSGYSPKHGHIEVWDTKSGTSYYGRGATRITNSAHALQNARVFVPVSNLKPVTMAPQKSGGAPTAVYQTNQVTVQVKSTNASAGQIGRAVGDSVSRAATNANSNIPKLSPAR